MEKGFIEESLKTLIMIFVKLLDLDFTVILIKYEPLTDRLCVRLQTSKARFDSEMALQNIRK